MTSRYIPLGAIVGAHGIAGSLKLKLYNPGARVPKSPLSIRLTRGTRSIGYALEEARPHKRIVLVRLKGIDEIAAAEQFVGYELSVPEEALEPLGRDQYYYLDVLGFDVYDARGNRLGKINRIWFKEGGDLYVVHQDQREYLIPAAKDFVETVDIPGRRIVVDPPEGLLDL